MSLIQKTDKFLHPRLRNLIFFVTSRCPLKCKHCFYSSELNKRINELTIEEIEKIIKKMPHLESVQLSGGEPFARKDLVDIIKIFKNYNIKSIGIPTNGYLVSSIVKKSKKIKNLGVKFNVTISIDGNEELHDKIRGVKGSFKNAIRTFDGLKKEKIRTGFSVALSKLNYEDFLNILKFLKNQDPDYINVILVRAKKDIMLSKEEFKKIRKKIEEEISCYLTPFYRKRLKLLNDVYEEVLGGNLILFDCLAGRIIAVLEPDGEVRSCELRRKLGNVREYNYDINKILEKDSKPKRCKCIHSCFLGPSMSYNLKWLLKNILFQYV